MSLWVLDGVVQPAPRRPDVLDEEDEEAVARGLKREYVIKPVKPGNGLELCAGGPMVQGVDAWVVLVSGCFVSTDDGEGGLSVVVCQEKIVGGGDTPPGAADGTAADERFRRKTDEDLPDDNLFWEAGEETSCHGSLGHSRRLAGGLFW